MKARSNMPPRWGWGFGADVANYKPVAPLALVKTRTDSAKPRV